MKTYPNDRKKMTDIDKHTIEIDRPTYVTTDRARASLTSSCYIKGHKQKVVMQYNMLLHPLWYILWYQLILQNW